MTAAPSPALLAEAARVQDASVQQWRRVMTETRAASGSGAVAALQTHDETAMLYGWTVAACVLRRYMDGDGGDDNTAPQQDAAAPPSSSSSSSSTAGQ
jgi:hypothetical protein